MDTREYIDARSKLNSEYLYWKDQFEHLDRVKLYDAFTSGLPYSPKDGVALQLHAIEADLDALKLTIEATFPCRKTLTVKVGFEFMDQVFLGPEKADYLIGYFRQAYSRESHNATPQQNKTALDAENPNETD